MAEAIASDDIVLTFAKMKNVHDKWLQIGPSKEVLEDGKEKEEMITLHSIECSDGFYSIQQQGEKEIKNQLESKVSSRLNHQLSVKGKTLLLKVDRIIIEFINSIDNLQVEINNLSDLFIYHKVNDIKLKNLFIEIEYKKKYLLQVKENVENIQNNLSLPSHFVKRRHSFHHLSSSMSSTTSLLRGLSFNIEKSHAPTTAVKIASVAESTSIDLEKGQRRKRVKCFGRGSDENCKKKLEREEEEEGKNNRTMNDPLVCLVYTNQLNNNCGRRSRNYGTQDEKDTALSALEDKEKDLIKPRPDTSLSKLSTKRNSSRSESVERVRTSNVQTLKEGKLPRSSGRCFKFTMVLVSSLILLGISFMLVHSFIL